MSFRYGKACFAILRGVLMVTLPFEGEITPAKIFFIRSEAPK